MTRKDYIIIAHAIRQIKSASPDTVALTIELAIANLTMTLKADNPRFDAQRFYAACQSPKE